MLETHKSNISLVSSSLKGRLPSSSSFASSISFPMPQCLVPGRASPETLHNSLEHCCLCSRDEWFRASFGCLQLDGLTERDSNFKGKILLCKQSWDEIYHKTGTGKSLFQTIVTYLFYFSVYQKKNAHGERSVHKHDFLMRHSVRQLSRAMETAEMKWVHMLSPAEVKVWENRCSLHTSWSQSSWYSLACNVQNRKIISLGL